MRVLVYGWYGQSNVGDDLFADAFLRLWPEIEFTFTNRLRVEIVHECDAIIFGGGSFLDSPVWAEPEAIEAIGSKPILYIGVGLETKIHPTHRALIDRSRIVAARSTKGIDQVSDCLVIPDLVYSLGSASSKRSSNGEKNLIFMANVSVLPTREEPMWKHEAWNYFRSECCQFLDEAIESGWTVRFFSMCRSEKLDDDWPATEIISRMKNRSRDLLLPNRTSSFSFLMDLLSSQSVVVTQRFHGSILADMAGVPSVKIAHHSKLTSDDSISYYGATKSLLAEAVEKATRKNERSPSGCPGVADFKNLINSVRRILNQ